MTNRQGYRIRVAVMGIALLTVASAATVAASTVVAAARTDDALAGLRSRLDQILSDARVVDSQAGILVGNAASGETLYARQPRARMLPASNNKVFTSAAAMDVLGPDFRFATRVAADGLQHGTFLAGNLYLKGTGDPTMLPHDYDDLAAKVASAGISVITGRLVADDTAFDNVRLGAEWGWDDEPSYYAPQISALTVASDTDYDPDTIRVEVRPAAAGRPAQLTVAPDTRYVTLVNRTTTGAAGLTTSIAVERQHGTNTIVVSGSIPAGGAMYHDESTVWEPTGYVASLFRDALARHGVTVLGQTSTKATPQSARTIADHQSMTLAQMLVPFLKLSNNGHAEALTKAMGRVALGKGSWDAGLRAATQSLARLGLDTAVIRREDGSGLSRQNLVTPTEITKLYRAVARKPWFPAFYEALPVAGAPGRLVGGTLRNRMRGTPAANNLHGKTGTLTGVSALSGYVNDADGNRLIFSIMLNNHLSDVKDVEDRIAVTLASYHRNGSSTLARQPTQAPVQNTDWRLATRECTWVRAC